MKIRMGLKVTSTGPLRQRLSFIRGILSFWFLCTVCLSGAVPDLRLEEDRIWLEARNSSIRDILEAFAHAGVSVKVGPGVEASVTGRAEGRPVDSVLKEILGPFDFVIYWSVLDGPEGRIELLRELKVYRPGYAQSLKEIQTPSGLLDIRRLQGHPDHVRDELLVGFKPGTTKAEQANQKERDRNLLLEKAEKLSTS